METTQSAPKTSLRRKILYTMLIALIALLAYGGYRIYPFVRAAPISDTEADAMMASFNNIASEIESRPAADREAYEKLLEQWKEKFKRIENQTPHFDKCPILPEDLGSDLEVFLMEYSKLSDAVANIVDDGFEWRQEFTFDSEIVNFLWVRQWAYWEITSAYLNAKSHQNAMAMAKINRVKMVIATLYKTPALIHLMIGVAIENIMYKGVAAIIPFLSDDELQQLAKSFQNQSNITEAFKTGIKLETVWFSNNLDHLKSEPDPNALSNLSDMNIPKPVRVLMLKFYTKFMLHRERNFYLALVRNTLAMIDSGEISKDPPWIEFSKEGYKSLTSLLAWPNYRNLFNRANAVETRRSNIIKALNSESALTPEERMTKRSYSYDDESSIHIESEIGCIKKD